MNTTARPHGVSAFSLRAALVLALAAGAAAFRTAPAGEYHYGANLFCSECHTAHDSQRHRLDGGAFPGDAPWDEAPLGAGPNNSLLRQGTVNALCLSCHDGQTFAPDVRGENSVASVRAAGALTTDQAPYERWKGHTLGVRAAPPGHANLGTACNACHTTHFGVSRPLDCIHCHEKHGGEGYRNLPGVTYAKGTNDLTRDVFLRRWVKGEVDANYDVSASDLNEPDPTRSGVGAFCRRCHGRFFGRQGDVTMGGTNGVAWLRHPMSNSDIGAEIGGERSRVDWFAGHAYRPKVMSATGEWGTQGVAWAGTSTLTPTCITCHKAHGNQNPFGLVFLEGTGPLTEEGDAAGAAGRVPTLCRQCHPIDPT